MIPDENELKYILPREKLVELLYEKGIRDPKILEAFRRVPRHKFVDAGLENYAYEDRPLPIGEGQTISQPFTVAYMTHLLEVKPGDKILEIGTGSGYQAAILSELGAHVYTLERIKSLHEQALKKLKNAGYTPVYAGYGNGFEGLPEFAPYDKIIVTAAAPHIPPALIDQLKHGGIMVIPVGKDSQLMHRIIKKDSWEIIDEVYDRFAFVPMLPGKK
jgi:protein-L-isoaspartate(D-aspartate) O-methyltransferase